MTSDNSDETPETDERCGATCRDGTPCPSYPVRGSNRCRMHGAGGGPPKGSANALTHGSTASPLNLLNHLEPEELEWVEALVDAYLSEAPFGPESPKVERLTRTCVMIYQEWAGQEAIFDEGLGVDSTIAVNDRGEPVVQTQEHYLCRRIDRLNDKIRFNLKELGLIGEQTTSTPTQDELTSDSYTIILEPDEDGDHWSTGDADDENDENLESSASSGDEDVEDDDR